MLNSELVRYIYKFYNKCLTLNQIRAQKNDFISMILLSRF